ncbi:MAG: glycosyl hydrolase family 28-related protein [Acidobacteriaceae bacterium]
MRKFLCLVLLLALAAPLFAQSQSVFTERPNDPNAVYLKAPSDGVADASAALQAAINKVQATANEGIVFVPSGRYRITRTIYVWPSVRIIGYGPTRPLFVLAPNSPGYSNSLGYMFFFAGGRPGYLPRWFHPSPSAPATPGIVPPNNTVPDANAGTFYSAMSNVDIQIDKGNPGAVAIRFHVAQHCYLSHMVFHIGSGLAAIKDVGNEAEDLHFYGGQYGIISGQTSPGWQFTLLDSSFQGQRVAAIREHEVGLTMSHDVIRNTPRGIVIDKGYPDEVWIDHTRFEHITGPAITISDDLNPRTEVTMRSIACLHVPVFAKLRESGKTLTGKGDSYFVSSFTHGLTLASAADQGTIRTRFHANAQASLPSFSTPVIRALPPMQSWVNVQSLGVQGNGKTDDTAALQQAIDHHRVLYFPIGHYIITGTLHLRPDTVIIGLHPSSTQLVIPDGTAAFQGVGAPVPLIEAPKGGDNIVSGLGLYTNGINPRAVAALWMSGPNSLMDDVRFLGGHGTDTAGGKRLNPYNSTHTGDPDPLRRWDSQYPSLWITNGGGGTFADIWTPSTFAQAGLYISHTATPGRIYELSCEHHVRNEVKLNHVANWKIFALQTEEEWGESATALPLEIQNSHNILIANYHSYRVIGSYHPFPEAIRVTNSSNIQIRNLFVNSNSVVPFDNSVDVQSTHTYVRAFNLAVLNLPGHTVPPPPNHAASVLAAGARLQKLAGGFFTLGGAAVSPTGQLYFVDTRFQRIYRWDAAKREAVVVRDTPIQPRNLVFDKSGDLIVTSYLGNGTVYTFKPGTPETEITLLPPQKAQPRPGATPVLPTGYWSIDGENPRPHPWQYVSPDGSLYLSTTNSFVNGVLSWGTKMAPVLHASGLVKAVPGHPFYLTAQSDEQTWKANVTDSGAITGMSLFAQKGGDSVVQDSAGDVFLAAGQIYVYGNDGKQIGIMDVPQRPIGLLFGGKEMHTLYILTHGNLYSIRTLHPGL